MTRRVVQQPPMYSTSLGGTFRPKYTSVPFQNEDIQPQKKVTITVIKAGLLIPGDGEPVKDSALVIADKLIAWIGPQSDIPSRYTDAPHRSYTVPYLMPGLWDCHAHFMMGSPNDAGNGDAYLGILTEHPSAMGARLTRGCWLAIQRGYTSMRDVAGLGCEISKVIDEGTIVGPNVYSSGSCLSQTAGHGDIFSLPAGDVLLNLGVSQISPGHFGTFSTMLVDGVDECRKAVRLQIRRGAKCIKILASGGVMSRDDNPLYAQFSPEELQTIVEEATRQGRAVAAHVHGKPGILAAVKAGVTTVEHVSFADQECIDLIKEKGTIYIATRLIMDMIIDSGGEGIPKYAYEKAKICAENHLVAYKMAIEQGLPIALGTDTGPGFNMAMELESAVKAGMSNLEAIKAATANGPLSVGSQAPKTGQLKVGYEADVIGVLENPVEDVKVLQKIGNIGWVWKGGKIFKGPGVGPWGESEWWGDEASFSS
ncbi:hypothetical protein K4K51_000586 [Colletotrichum sp. SAR 10_75]|nr:hypothetical protein K4K51_000586 [Colletotrichum sp. SAR 10_75]